MIKVKSMTTIPPSLKPHVILLFIEMTLEAQKNALKKAIL